MAHQGPTRTWTHTAKEDIERISNLATVLDFKERIAPPFSFRNRVKLEGLETPATSATKRQNDASANALSTNKSRTTIPISVCNRRKYFRNSDF